jgi:hypothetical protein
MADFIKWTGNTSNDWTTAANWSPATVPQAGDTALIPPGTSTAPTISALGVKCTIILGQANSGSVALNVAAPEFSATPMTIIGDSGTTALKVTLSIQQACTFSGQIRITAPGSTVTITADTPDTAFTFFEKAFVLVAPGSSLDLAAGCFITAGLFEIAGAVTIASGASVEGGGLLAIENGGHLAISGTVQLGQQIAFADGTGCITLSDPAAFQGTIGFASVANAVGGLIFLPGLSAQFMTLVAQPDETLFVMTVFGTGGVVTLYVNLLDEQFLTAIQNPGWTAADFMVTDDPDYGTIVTYVPQGPPSLQQSLPVTIIADAITAAPVPLSTIFLNAFGTQAPGFSSITLQVPGMPAYSETDHRYWRFPNVAAAWLDEDNNPITTATKIAVKDIAGYSLRVGNNIACPAQFVAQVTPTGSPVAGTVTYSIWTADPKVAQGISGAAPQAENVVGAAVAMNAYYPDVPNTNLCNWIADCVAAAAGAPMPPLNTQFDPLNNVDGGFWRIAYRGDGTTPYADWGTQVLPGDIVRMEWQSQSSLPSGPLAPLAPLSGHTTTILQNPIPLIQPNPMSPITLPNFPMVVYDNDAPGPAPGQTLIAIHTDNYWLNTNPASITIYRLDPKGQYLIYGSPLGEFIQGSIHNNLIIPGGGADTITAGTGSNEIQGTKAELAVITVTDFHAGDVFNFTDLDPTTATVSFKGGTLTVMESNTAVAAISLPRLAADTNFIVASNGNQPPEPVGTLIWILPES